MRGENLLKILYTFPLVLLARFFFLRNLVVYQGEKLFLKNLHLKNIPLSIKCDSQSQRSESKTEIRFTYTKLLTEQLHVLGNDAR